MTTNDDSSGSTTGVPDLDVWRAEAGAALEGADKATTGPWAFDSYSTVFSAPVSQERDRLEDLIPDEAMADDPVWKTLPNPKVCGVPCVAGDTGTRQGCRDAAFIAAARTGWPRDAARVGVLCARVAALEAHVATPDAMKAIGDRQEALADRFAARCEALESALREALDGWDRSHFPAPVRRADAETIARLRALAAGTSAAAGEEPTR